MSEDVQSERTKHVIRYYVKDGELGGVEASGPFRPLFEACLHLVAVGFVEHADEFQPGTLEKLPEYIQQYMDWYSKMREGVDAKK